MRIISGKFRGRMLLPPKGLVTRPITDRVKESLFNILMPRIDGSIVADIFCGTGSMGLEAISRGADAAYFADRDLRAINSLKDNISQMQIADQCRIWRGDILSRLTHWLDACQEPLDIVFLDPPYPMATAWRQDSSKAKIASQRVFEPLAKKLSPDGQIIFRTPKDLPAPDYCECVTLAQRREYGSMAINFLQSANGTDNGS